MGYYTIHHIEVYEKDGKTDPPAKVVDKALARLCEISDYEFKIGWNDSNKWYDEEVNMNELSLEYPELVFQIRGEGEEQPDIWQKYYYNGKMQYWNMGEPDYPDFIPEE